MTPEEFRKVEDDACSAIPPSVAQWEALTNEQRETISDLMLPIVLPADWPERTERICILCRYWRFDPGTAGYSAYTPGDAASIECRRGHWKTGRFYSDETDDYAILLLTARTCGDFTPSRIALENPRSES